MSENRPVVSRRGFLKAGAAAAALASGGRLIAAEAKKPIPIGIQLYSVRGECKKDFVKTIEALGKMGYDGVEFAGYYGRKAPELKKLLDDNGLKCCGTHTGVPTLLGGNLATTIAFNKAIGNKFLIVPGMPGKYRKDGWDKAAEVFNGIAAKCTPQGMRCGYHNHTHEFKGEDGKTPWDLFFGNAAKEVVMQLDIGHCLNAGSDPAAVIRKYPGRAATVHVRESGGDGVVGKGKVKWNEVFEACSTVGGTEWYIVEFGGSPLGGIECAKRCLAGVKELTNG